MPNNIDSGRLHLSKSSCGDEHDPTAITVDVAQQFIIDCIKPLAFTKQERLSLRQSIDRVLAEDIIAEMNVPPYDNSAMDGFAFCADDIPRNGTVTLKVVGNSFAGHPFLGRCTSGECVRIMTGAVIPAGCNTVIPQEHV